MDPTLGLAPRHAPPDPGRQLADVQRARVLAAMVDVARENGVANATVARVVARAGVSRRTFYELFPDREACFLAACQAGLERVSGPVLDAYDPRASWIERLRTALTALLTFLDAEPDDGWLLIVGSPGGGPQVLAHRRLVLDRIIAFLDEGRRAAKKSEDPPPLTAEGLVGGVLALIHSRMVDEHPAPLTEMLPSLMAMLVLPYLGSAAARRELARPAPPARNGRPAGVSADPLRELDMRLTYRTIRVLLAIGELGERGPHPSNRQVADAAGIRDQGQVSKLLARLEQLGLIENAEPRIKGEPNAWTLTKRGEEVRVVVSV